MTKRKESPKRLGFYASEVARITGCSELEAVVVEEIMRNSIFHSTLDWQTPEEFRTGALEAYQALKEMRLSRTLPKPYQRLLQSKGAHG